MRTNGLCVDQDNLCKSGIRHPLSYYRIKTRKPRKENEEKGEEIEGARPKVKKTPQPKASK
jgi:hypothetical protein